MSDKQAENWWDKLRATIWLSNTQPQTQRGIQLFTGQNQEYEMKPKQGIICKQIRFNQNNQETFDIQTEQQNNAHKSAENEIEH